METDTWHSEFLTQTSSVTKLQANDAGEPNGAAGDDQVGTQKTNCWLWGLDLILEIAINLCQSDSNSKQIRVEMYVPAGWWFSLSILSKPDTSARCWYMWLSTTLCVRHIHILASSRMEGLINSTQAVYLVKMACVKNNYTYSDTQGRQAPTAAPSLLAIFPSPV